MRLIRYLLMLLIMIGIFLGGRSIANAEEKTAKMPIKNVRQKLYFMEPGIGYIHYSSVLVFDNFDVWLYRNATVLSERELREGAIIIDYVKIEKTKEGQYKLYVSKNARFPAQTLKESHLKTTDLLPVISVGEWTDFSK